MRNLFNTLKGRLFLFISLIIIPCYIFIYLSLDYSRNIIKEEFIKMAEIVSFQAAETQSNITDSSRSFLAALVRTSQVQDPDSDVCQRFIADLTPLYDHFINIGVSNNRGILTCNGIPLAEPIDVSDRKYIRDAINKKQFTSSGVLLDRATGSLAINFASPVYNNKHQVVGVAVIVMSLDWWRTLMNKNRLPENSISYVLDGNNRSVASYPKNMVYEAPSVLNAVWRGQDGISRVYSEHQINDENGITQLKFLTGIAVDTSLTSLNQHYIMIIITLTISIMIIIVLARLFFVNSISSSLKILSDLAIRLGRNEKIYASRPTGLEEMDSLQDRFIEMAEHKQRAEKKIIHQAQTDSLTGISNRHAFGQILYSALVEANVKQSKLGIILFDLDNFKDINDMRGHEVGDKILIEIATRLLQHFPDAKCISRLGGDEFVFLFEDEKMNFCQILMLSDEIKNIVKQPYHISSENVLLTASFGVAIYPDDGSNISELMSAADQAMYYAKFCGRDNVRRFDWDLRRSLVNRIELIKDMRTAIKYKEFYLVYQPIIDQKGKVTKFEALIRWAHPVKGQIPPDQFIPFAEESGQIIEIGTWVIKEAKQALAQLQVVYGHELQVSVNVSPLQLSKIHGEQLRLLSDLKKQGDELIVGKPFINGLIIEITENLLMNLDENTRENLLYFKEQGIQVALDDFGTGYSSLAYIMNYDIDYLKIDKSFVNKIESETSSISLCETIISMAHKLGISVIAEGVETSKQANLLLDCGCNYLQGYYFSKPMTLEEAINYKT